jgi:hypothetical protein
VSKAVEWFINYFESFMCMRAWGACGLALGGLRVVKVDPWEGGGLRFKSSWWELIF